MNFLNRNGEEKQNTKESFRTGEVLMDSGSIHRTLLAYALPVLLMQLLQQLYNIADCAVIGRLCGGFGLAAVGVAGLILAVHINFFIGFSVGVTSAVSRLFGARDFGKLRAMIATSVWLAAGAGLFLTILGERLGENYLAWLACPAEAMDDALLYLRICLLGLIPQLVYNVANGVFRALGNTRTPLLWLAASAVLNIGLDLLLVGVWDFGFAGAALATLTAQWALGIGMIWRLTRLAGQDVSEKTEGQRRGPRKLLNDMNDDKRSKRLEEVLEIADAVPRNANAMMNQHRHRDCKAQRRIQIVCRRLHRREKAQPVRDDKIHEQREENMGQGTPRRPYHRIDLFLPHLGNGLDCVLPPRGNLLQVPRRENRNQNDDGHRDIVHDERLFIQEIAGKLHDLAMTDFVHTTPPP